MLVGADVLQVVCDQCRAKASLKDDLNPNNFHARPKVSQQGARPGSKQNSMAEGGYRIIFSDKHTSAKEGMILSPQKHHTKTNIRDRSLDNFHGDADFKSNPHQASVPASRGADGSRKRDP